MNDHPFPPSLNGPAEIALVLLKASIELAQHSHRAFRLRLGPARSGRTLRPGRETPLWNIVRRQLKAQLKTYGQQALVARLLGLPRQRINAFVTGGAQMPDAERTLQLLIWLNLVRAHRPPG